MKTLFTYPEALKNNLGVRLHKKRIQRDFRRQVELQLANGEPLKLVIGAGAGLHFVGASASNHEGWFLTDEATLDALNPNDWRALFQTGIVERIMAEHVIEHWTEDGFRMFLSIAKQFLAPDGNIRIAVPDGFHPDRTYNYQTLGSILSKENWSYDLLEYFDERGVFHRKAWDITNGFVERSEHHDPRNEERPLSYTSLIVDLHPK